MSNLNTFADALYESNGGQPITMTLNNTGNSGNFTGYPFTVGSVPLYLNIPSTVNPIFGPALKSRSLSGAIFKLRAAGSYQVNTGTDIVMLMSLVNASGFPLGGPFVENKNVQVAAGFWCIDCTLAWNGSNLIAGYYLGWIGGDNGPVDFAVSGPNSTITGIGSVAPPIQFAISAQVKSGNPTGNQFTLSEFSADLI